MLDRTIAPPAVTSATFQLPSVRKTLLPSGLAIHHLGDVRQAIAQIEVVFNAGRWYEQKPETSYFTTKMLEKGTTAKNALQLASLFDFYGAHMETSSNFDFVSVSLYTLSKHLAALLPTFCEVISSPSFDPQELSQLKDTFLQHLHIQNEKTSYRASNLIREKVFGAGHPYGGSPSAAAVKNITPEDLHIFFKTKMSPAHIFILGDVSSKDITGVEDFFGGLAVAKQPPVSFNAGEHGPSFELAPRETSVQSSIRLGKKAILRMHPHYPGLLMLNYILGGYFGSRLMKNIREEKGLTYGISSSVHSLCHESSLLIGAEVNKENRELVSREIKTELNKLRVSVIAQQELDSARQHFIGGLQMETDSPFSVLGKIKNTILHDLPSDYYQSLIHSINRLSPDDLHETANIYLDESSFSEVIVG